MLVYGVDEMETITVMGYNGKDKEITREAFITQWWDSCQLWNLIDYHDLDVMNAMRDELRISIEAMAGKSWDLKREAETNAKTLREAI